MAEAVGSITLEVVVRTPDGRIEQQVGTITVPVRLVPNEGAQVATEDIETALGILSKPEPRTRKGRRQQAKAGAR